MSSIGLRCGASGRLREHRFRLRAAMFGKPYELHERLQAISAGKRVFMQDRNGNVRKDVPNKVSGSSKLAAKAGPSICRRETPRD